MKKLQITFAAMLFAIALFSCNYKELPTSSGNEEGVDNNPKGSNITVNANPAIIWRTNETINRMSVDTYWVMDANGGNAIRIYCPSITSGKNKTIVPLGVPHWSPDGNYICFAMKGSLYKLTISVVNGVPTASNATMLLDTATYHIAPGESYWSFGTTNEIIFCGKNTTDNSSRIYAISANGGSPTSIYTGASGWVLKYATVNQDGSKIAFTEASSGDVYIKVINRNDGSEAYTPIKVRGSGAIMNGAGKLDWARTSGSTTIAMTGSATGSSINQIFTLDVSDASTLNIARSGPAQASSWSPDDSKLVYCETGSSTALKTVTISGGAVTTLYSSFAYEMNWKK